VNEIGEESGASGPGLRSFQYLLLAVNRATSARLRYLFREATMNQLLDLCPSFSELWTNLFLETYISRSFLRRLTVL
jgi:hypothetical protein